MRSYLSDITGITPHPAPAPTTLFSLVRMPPVMLPDTSNITVLTLNVYSSFCKPSADVVSALCAAADRHQSPVSKIVRRCFICQVL